MVSYPTNRCSIESIVDYPLTLGNDSSEPSRILYLLQTEECLPSQLRTALGNSSACQCDVVVLSYRNICNDTSLPHVRYLFNSSTTWTTGRNLLFYTNIHKKSDRYLYYIMMDDDIHLKWRKRWEQEFETKDPWRCFEEFLRGTTPAIATLELSEALLIHIENIHIKKHCCMELEYTTTVRYDGAFHAFHYQAVEYVLPYWDQLDNVSWYYSQLHLFTWTEVVFRGQVLVHRQLMAYNPMHRPYPRLGNYSSVLPAIIKDIRERLPAKCQNASLLGQSERVGFEHLHTESPTYCLPPPPPKQAIIPFENFYC